MMLNEEMSLDSLNLSNRGNDDHATVCVVHYPCLAPLENTFKCNLDTSLCLKKEWTYHRVQGRYAPALRTFTSKLLFSFSCVCVLLLSAVCAVRWRSSSSLCCAVEVIASVEKQALHRN